MEEVRSSNPVGETNWVHTFRTFEEVATVLRTSLRLSGPLRRRALEANLVEELGSNAEHLLARLRGTVVPVSRLLLTEDVPIPSEAVADLDRHQTATIWLFRFSLPGPGALATQALADAISSGEFLTFQPSTGRLVISPMQEVMLRLRERVTRYETLLELLSTNPSLRELAGLMNHPRNVRLPVSTELRTVLYAIRDEAENVASLTRAILRHLSGVDDILVVPPVNPPSPVAEEAARIEESTVTRGDALAWALN